ncbi:hypothetical protein QE152_g34313 [Popillia japonica]|uniref:Uncharacterized protein n=1 Tax=Popillia japonica TaxID=7064 RepID=A0AAW1IUR6_POPJA
MGVLEDFKALYEDRKVFKTNISRDNQERRKNLELTQKKLIALNQFVTASNSLRTQASLDSEELTPLPDGVEHITAENANPTIQRIKRTPAPVARPSTSIC